MLSPDQTVERYRLQTRQHADLTARLVLATLGSPLFVPLSLVRLIVANKRARLMAFGFVNLALVREGRSPIQVTFLAENEAERLTTALETVQHGSTGQAERLARSEPLAAGQKALSGHLKTAGMAWTRHVGPAPCSICMGLADGSILPGEVPMTIPHPSCSCVPKLVSQ